MKIFPFCIDFFVFCIAPAWDQSLRKQKSWRLLSRLREFIMIKVTEHRHRVKGLFLCFTFFNPNPKPFCSVAVTLTGLQLVLPPAQSKLWYFQAPDILFAAIKSLSSCRALGCPRYSSHLPALQGRWQKLYRNIIFAASARCRRPLQFHFKCTFLH